MEQMINYNAMLSNSIWVAIAAVLVLFMNFGLAFFYGGMVSGRNVLNTIKMSIVTLGIIPIVWWALGYSLVFAKGGAFQESFHQMFFNHVDVFSAFPGTKVMTVSFICFQAMFASISPAIMSGSGVERLRFDAYLIFIALWVVLIYCTIAHSFWNADGWAANFGAFDFAGGNVVHVSAGFSGLALAFALKPRKNTQNRPHNLPFMTVGCGLLWFGWFGFNGGSSLDVSGISLIAIANTMFATAAAMTTWVLCDAITGRAKTATGLCSSLVMGLVAITPSAGYVTIGSAIEIGAITAVLAYFLILYYNKLKHKVDDTLDVFVCHGIPGFIGSIMVGVFASHTVNSAIPDGLIYGNFMLVYKQVVATGLTAFFSFFGTWVLLYVLKHVIKIRVESDSEDAGLDTSVHGERAYQSLK